LNVELHLPLRSHAARRHQNSDEHLRRRRDRRNVRGVKSGRSRLNGAQAECKAS